MPPRTILFVSLALGGISVSGIAVEERSHARDLQKRAEVHCGAWVMQCGGTRGGDGVSIEDICNKYIKPVVALLYFLPLTSKAPAFSKST
jgi:hypothetical protein